MGTSNQPATLEALADKHRPTFRTATAYVAAVLREAIFSGTLAEGEALRQEELAASFGVSRMPVREALRLLEADGLVEFSPHRGAVVAGLSEEDIIAVFDIRFALETLALRQSIPVLDASTIERAEAILDEMDSCKDLDRWTALDRRFHMTLSSNAAKRILDLISAQHDAIDRCQRLELSVMDNKEKIKEGTQIKHRALLSACRRRDIDGAIAILQRHVTEAGRDLVRMLKGRLTKQSQTKIDR